MAESIDIQETEESSEIESTVIVAKETTEVETTVPVTKDSPEDLNVIIGKWTLDSVKTQEEMEKLGTNLQAEFGTGIHYGAGAQLREDGYFSFYVGVGVGGEGTYLYEKELVTVDYELYVDCVDKMEIVLYPKMIDGKDYLVLKMYGQELYLLRE